MKSTKKNKLFENYLLSGKFRKNGFEKIRYVFSAVSRRSGEAKSFFVELYYVNPLLSPDSARLAQKSLPKVSPEDLQYVLAGTLSAQSSSQEEKIQPSYALVKCGFFGKGGKHYNCFYPSSDLKYVKAESAIYVGKCKFSSDSLSGEIAVSDADLNARPELLCNSGNMSWNLNFEKTVESSSMCKNGANFWIPGGARTVFSGFVNCNGENWAVLPRTSFGYIDKSWGTEFPSPYVHLSSSNMVSAITGKPMLDSCFAVEGEFDSKLSVFICLEGNQYSFVCGSAFGSYSEIHNLTEVPADADGEKLHWTVSIQRGKIVIDLDIFCRTAEMFVRDYEIPQGNRTLMKVLGGGTGFGEIRVYKKVKKTLELLDSVNFLDALVEYGTEDCQEE